MPFQPTWASTFKLIPAPIPTMDQAKNRWTHCLLNSGLGWPMNSPKASPIRSATAEETAGWKHAIAKTAKISLILKSYEKTAKIGEYVESNPEEEVHAGAVLD